MHGQKNINQIVCLCHVYTRENLKIICQHNPREHDCRMTTPWTAQPETRRAAAESQRRRRTATNRDTERATNRTNDTSQWYFTEQTFQIVIEQGMRRRTFQIVSLRDEEADISDSHCTRDEESDISYSHSAMDVERAENTGRGVNRGENFIF